MARGNKRDRWQKDVIRAKQLPSSTRLFLSSVLAKHMRANGHTSRPRRLLADEMGVDERTITRHFGRAVEAGWLAHVRGGYLGHTAEYEASWPDVMHGSMRDTSVSHMRDRIYPPLMHQTVPHMRDSFVPPSSSTSGTTRRLSHRPIGLCGVLDLDQSTKTKTQPTTRCNLRLVGDVA